MKFLVLALLFAYGAAETIRVRASIHCGFQKKTGLPVVSLMEEDFSHVPILSWFDSDDTLDETTVEYGEHFTLDGNEVEIFSTEPYLRIRHHCFSEEREDFVNLSQFEADPQGFIHLGHIVLKLNGYTIQ